MKKKKEELQFGHILNAISDINKATNIRDGWTNQELIVNGIFHYLNIQNLYPTYYVLAPQCSMYFNFNKNIPPKIKRFLLSQDKRQLILTVTNSLKKEKPFPVERVSEKIFYSYEIPSLSTTSIEDSILSKKQIEGSFLDNKYEEYFAKILLYTLLYSSNFKNEKASLVESLHFNQDIAQAIEEGRYYDFYERQVLIYPQIKEQTFKTILKKHYQTRYPRPSVPDQDYFSYTYSYIEAKHRTCNSLTQLIINGVDYTDKVEVVEEYKESDKFPYKKHYILKDYQQAEVYEIFLQDEYISDFPVRSGHFKLLSPTRRFKVSVEIRTTDNYKFSLSLKNFGNYNPLVKNIDMTRPNSLFSHFENLDWTLPSAGYSYTVKPRKDFWKECFNIDKE